MSITYLLAKLVGCTIDTHDEVPRLVARWRRWAFAVAILRWCESFAGPTHQTFVELPTEIGIDGGTITRGIFPELFERSCVDDRGRLAPLASHLL